MFDVSDIEEVPFKELERRAWVKGDTHIAALYANLDDLVSESDGRDAALLAEYNRGVEAGKGADTVAELDQCNTTIDTQKKQIDLLATELRSLLSFLRSKDSGTIANRVSRANAVQRILIRVQI